MDADLVNLILLGVVVVGTIIAQIVLSRSRPVVDGSRPSGAMIALVAFGPLIASVIALHHLA